MTRGRRKDMTIPPSRALLQQRDYRARKAQYLSELELRVKKAEEENLVLRKEVGTLQAKLQAATPPPAQSQYGPEVVCAQTPGRPSSVILTRLSPPAGCSILGPYAPSDSRCCVHNPLPAASLLPRPLRCRAGASCKPHPHNSRDACIHTIPRCATTHPQAQRFATNRASSTNSFPTNTPPPRHPRGCHVPTCSPPYHFRRPRQAIPRIAACCLSPPLPACCRHGTCPACTAAVSKPARARVLRRLRGSPEVI